MGMIQTLLQRLPDGTPPEKFITDVQRRLPAFAEGAEHWKAWFLKLEEFEEAWTEQDNIKKTAEIKERYRLAASAGWVVVV